MGNVVPEAPKPADFGKYQTFKFVTKMVNVGEEPEFQLPMAMSFVGVVQLPGERTYQAIFVERSTPFDKANADYQEELDRLLAIATEEGVMINSLEDLKQWASGEDMQAEVVDFAAAIEKMKGE